MNPTTTENRQPSPCHKITQTHALRDARGLLLEALVASVTQVLLAVEDVTKGLGRVEIVAINHRTTPAYDSTKVGTLDEDRGALNFFHSATNGKNWWHFHYKLKRLTGFDGHESLARSLARACGSSAEPGGMGSLGNAFEALKGDVTPEASPRIAAVTLRAPEKKTVSRRAKVATAAKKSTAQKRGDAKTLPKKSPKAPAKEASGPLPLDLNDEDVFGLLARNCRDAGLLEGKWLTKDQCAEAITLAIVDLANTADAPEEWVTLCRNRLAGDDLLRDFSRGGQTYYQLVLEGEEELPFGESETTSDVTSEGGRVEDALPEPVTPPDEVPAEPVEEPPPAQRVGEFSPAVEPVPGQALTELKRVNAEVQRLSRELSEALALQEEILLKL